MFQLHAWLERGWSMQEIGAELCHVEHGVSILSHLVKRYPAEIAPLLSCGKPRARPTTYCTCTLRESTLILTHGGESAPPSSAASIPMSDSQVHERWSALLRATCRRTERGQWYQVTSPRAQRVPRLRNFSVQEAPFAVQGTPPGSSI